MGWEVARSRKVSRSAPTRPGRPSPRDAARAVAPRAATRQVMTFLVRFALGWICALLLVSFVPGIERWAIRGTLHSLGWLAGLFTPSVEVAEPAFTLGGTRVNIVPDCTPLMPTTALWMAILAFPSSGRWKLVGALAGAAVLWLYNLGRILATVAVLKMRPEWFDFVHVYLWQTLTVVVLFALFVLWMRFEPRRRVAS